MPELFAPPIELALLIPLRPRLARQHPLDVQIDCFGESTAFTLGDFGVAPFTNRCGRCFAPFSRVGLALKRQAYRASALEAHLDSPADCAAARGALFDGVMHCSHLGKDEVATRRVPGGPDGTVGLAARP